MGQGEVALTMRGLEPPYELCYKKTEYILYVLNCSENYFCNNFNVL